MFKSMDDQADTNGTGPRLLYTTTEAAQLLSIGRSTVYELIDAHRLESVSIGRSRRIPAKALDDFIARLRSSDRSGRVE